MNQTETMNSSCSSSCCSMSEDDGDDKQNRLVQRKRGMFRRANSIDSLFGQPRARPGRLGRVRSDPQGNSSKEVLTPPLLVPRWESQHSSPRHQKRIKNLDQPPSTPRLCVMRNHSRSMAPMSEVATTFHSSSSSACPSHLTSSELNESSLRHCRWDSISNLTKDSPLHKPLPQPTRQLSPMRGL
jgi:hypothetical protein